MISNIKNRPIDLTESSREAKKSKFFLCDFPSRTIFPNATSQPIMHPDEYELMANYFSNEFEEQIGFFKVMSDLDNEPFLPLIKNISFLTTNITDKQWSTYHKDLGLTQTPRILILTSFTENIRDLQDLVLLTPWLRIVKLTEHTSISRADLLNDNFLLSLKTLTYTLKDFKNGVNLPHILQTFGAIETLIIDHRSFRECNCLSNMLNPFLNVNVFDFSNTSLNIIIVDNYNNVQTFLRNQNNMFVAID